MNPKPVPQKPPKPKMPLACRWGFHNYVYDTLVKVSNKLGPFDPHPDRTKKMYRSVCVNCGKVKLEEIDYSYC